MTPTLSIFVSSPGDVAQERALTEGVLRRLQGEFASRVELRPIFWEHEPLLATDSFQDQIVRPSETDIVVCILWSRLGTRLPERFRRPDGSRYESGTEFEFEDALEGWRANGRPDLLVYRKTAEPLVSLLDPDALMEKLRQRQALDRFVERWFHDKADGSLRAAYHQFATPEDFETTLERHLRALIDRRAPPASRAPRDEAAAAARWTSGSPFRGLEPFDEAHADVFFGRTRAISEVLDHLRAQDAIGRPFVVVTGMSGGGKSSLVRAGLLPLLTTPGVVEGVAIWRRAVMRPADQGGEPLLALATALLSEGALPELSASGTPDEIAALLRAAPEAIGPIVRSALERAGEAARLIVVVDQLEELFTLKGLAEGERGDFARAIEAIVKSGRVWVVATLRSDLYPRLAEVPELVELKEGQGQYDLLAPSAREITEMVRQPVLAAGLRLEVAPGGMDRLEDRLVDAAVGRPGSLPLLEFTLEELYRRRTDDGVLTLAAFEELGGVEGSIARRAEEVFSGLAPDVQAVFHPVMRQLVTVVENAEGTTVAARPAPLERLRNDAASEQMVDALIDARLLVTELSGDDGAIVRLAHEALLRHWPRLTDWLEEDRELLKTRARLRGAAFRWAEAGRDPDLLLTQGKPLEDARTVVAAGSRLSDLEADFVAESEQKGRRFVRLRRLAFAGLSILAVIAGITGWVARRAAVRAESQAYSATRTHEFMVGLLSLAQPSMSQGRETTVKDLLDAGSFQLLAGELGDVPATGAWAMRDLATSYVSLGELDDALTLARAADSLVALDPAVPDSVLALGWTLLAEIHQQRGSFDSAGIHFEKAIETWSRVSVPMLSNAVTGLALVRREQGRIAEYEVLMDSASALGLEHTDSTSLDYAVILSNDALRLMVDGEGERAEELLRRSERIWSSYPPGARLTDYAVLLTHLARARALQDDLVTADSLFREALAIERRVLPAGHPGLAVTLNNVALNAQELGDSVSAEAFLREAVDVAREGLGPDHPRTAAAMINLGEMLSHRAATADEADSLLLRALDGLSRSAPLNVDVSVALQNRGALQLSQGRFDSALVSFAEAYRVDSIAGRQGDAMYAAARGADVAREAADTAALDLAIERVFASVARMGDPRRRADALDDVQDILFNSSNFVPSERAARESLALREALDPEGSADLANSLADVAWWDAVTGARDSVLERVERAELYLARSQALLDSIPIEDAGWMSAHQALTFALSALDRRETVVEREAAAAERLRALGRGSAAVNALLRQGLALEQLERPAEAAIVYRQAEEWAVELLGPDHPLRDLAAERAAGAAAAG